MVFECKMFLKTLMVLCVIHFTNAAVWLHVGHSCIGAKDDSFYEMTYGGPSSFVGAAKLVHIKGYVSNRSTNKGSHWGSSLAKSLGTIITDEQNRILYPSPREATVSENGWYELPGYTGTSPRLVFSDFCAPQYFVKGRKFRIWYGEDWSGFTEFDNHGTSCMDVYFYLMS